MVESLRAGFNATIIAYGDSGSGKTHTMLGGQPAVGTGPSSSGGGAAPGPGAGAPAASPQDGLIPRVLRRLFTQLALEMGPAAPPGSGGAAVAGGGGGGTGSYAPSEAGDDASSCCGGGETPRAGVAAARPSWSAEMAFLQVYKQAEVTNLLSQGYAEAGGFGVGAGGGGSWSGSGSGSSSSAGAGAGAAPRRMRLAPVLEAGQGKLPRDVAGFLRRRGAMVPVATADEALARLRQGAALRCTCATVNNAESSRSHAVFLLELRIRSPRPDGSWLEQSPRLVMMDLAGSESFDSSGNAAETTAINTGLLWISNVLRDMADGAAHVNFNNHNLTRFLEVRGEECGGRGGRGCTHGAPLLLCPNCPKFARPPYP